MSFRLRWPTEFNGLFQHFGERPEVYKEFGLPGHEGLDFVAPTGSKVFACAKGRVSRIDLDGNKDRKEFPYGNQVRIVHHVDGEEYTTVYAHLEEVRVRLNDEVNAGDWIGIADSTGNSEGAHLHLTLKKKGATRNNETPYPNDIIDPTGFLDPFSSESHVPSFLIDDLRFLQDVTIPDNSVRKPGRSFVKTWKVLNAGSSTWGEGYTLNFIKDESMSAPEVVSLPSAKPGEAVDVSVRFTAPHAPGFHRSTWRARNAKGEFFGTILFTVISVPERENRSERSERMELDRPLDNAEEFPTWRVIASDGIRVRSDAGLNADVVTRFAVGSQFRQTGPLVEADGYIWAPHRKGFSAIQEIGGPNFAVMARNQGGVHLDPRNQTVIGAPHINDLGNIHWLRINYDVSFEEGKTDINAAFQFYEPICVPYLEAGKRIIFVLTHETFGENIQGLPVIRPAEFANFVADIVNQWKQWNHQIVWEIWNEPDVAFADPNFDPSAPHASHPLTPVEFAHLLGLTIRRIRNVDPNSVLIAGGLMKGNPDYLKETLNSLPEDVRLDGIAIHPYGQDPGKDPRFGPHGSLLPLMKAYKKHAGKIPLYITEWGVLDQPNEPVNDVAEYAKRLLAASSEIAECAIWYAWADQIHNGYGLVDVQQNKKDPLYGVFAI